MAKPRHKPLPARDLRWRCNLGHLPFKTTADVEPVAGVIGQASAVEALDFGLTSDAPGQNVFVRGLTGTGRMTLVKRLMENLRPSCSTKRDRCYVHNFSEPHRPRTISLAPGTARDFRRRMKEFAEFIRDDLADALQTEAFKAQRELLEQEVKNLLEALTEPFEKDLREAGLALVTVTMGPVARTAILPVRDGKALSPEELEQLRAQGKFTDEEHDEFKKKRDGFQRRLEEVTVRMKEIREEGTAVVRDVVAKGSRDLLYEVVGRILSAHAGEDVARFLDEVVDDVIEHRILTESEDAVDPLRAYGVNIIVCHPSADACPVVMETAPTLANLLGTIEREWGPQGPVPSGYTMIRAGSLLKADGGYLILEARDVLTEPGAWKVLLRTLRSGRLEMVPPELTWPIWQQGLKPESIPMKIRVILMGDAGIYQLLDRHDPDFGDLFKVLADFGNTIKRDEEGITQYAGVLARIAADENLPPLNRKAVAALVEHGARVAGHGWKLTARFGRIADIAREAAWLASREGKRRTVVGGDHVLEAIGRTKHRADLPSRRFQELLADGTIRVQTQGEVVGQINGLAVMSAGPLVYGFPARITATVGAGTLGIINIEEQSALSGSIHTKGFQILGGLMRSLLRTDHPLAFSASLAFEQSYGGIDGDSASGAEICCLLSALTGVPLRQGVAMTGSIDQMGHVQAVGGVNEKIEGFYDTCLAAGLTGEQGVILPLANVSELMLRPDVVDACRKKRFSVWSAECIQDALEILTGIPAGRRDPGDGYPEGTMLALAQAQAREYWLRALQSPTQAEIVRERIVAADGSAARFKSPS